MTGRISTLLLALTFAVSMMKATAMAQQSGAVNSMLLDTRHPSLYLEYDHEGQRKSDYPGESSERLWLRIHNNTREAICIQTHSLYLGPKVAPLKLQSGKGLGGGFAHPPPFSRKPPGENSAPPRHFCHATPCHCWSCYVAHPPCYFPGSGRGGQSPFLATINQNRPRSAGLAAPVSGLARGGAVQLACPPGCQRAGCPERLVWW